MEKSRKIILHVCCAICGAYLSEILKKDFDQVLLYFYNPNIHPEEEYKKRLESAKKLAKTYDLEIIEGEYDIKNWFNCTKGLENELEGGKRCDLCFDMRLEKTAQIAKKEKAEYFTTTLAASSFKDEKLIKKIGGEIADKYSLEFINFFEDSQFKKEAWQKARKLARDLNFYHQKYCGCVFSQRK